MQYKFFAGVIERNWFRFLCMRPNHHSADESKAVGPRVKKMADAQLIFLTCLVH